VETFLATDLETSLGADVDYVVGASQTAVPRIYNPLIIGDSNTKGSGASFFVGWPSLLSVDIGTPVNKAEPGTWMGYDPGGTSDDANNHGALAQIDTWLSTYNGNSVIIALGTNDLVDDTTPAGGYAAPAESVQYALANIVMKCKEKPSIKDIIVMGILPYGLGGTAFDDERAAYNSWASGFCFREGIIFYDWYADAVDGVDTTKIKTAWEGGDSIHLNSAGQTGTALAMDTVITNDRLGSQAGAVRKQTQNALTWNTTIGTPEGTVALDTTVYANDTLTQIRGDNTAQLLPNTVNLPTSGKHYIEVEILRETTSALGNRVGFTGVSFQNTWGWNIAPGSFGAAANWPGVTLNDESMRSASTQYGNIANQNLGAVAGTRIGLAWDADADAGQGRMYMSVWGRWLASDPSAGTGGILAATDAGGFRIVACTGGNGVVEEFDIRFVDRVPVEVLPTGYNLWDGTA